MIERVNLVIQMKVKLEVIKYDAEVCSQSSRADEGYSYLRRNERNIEVSFGFYESSMIMISGRP